VQSPAVTRLRVPGGDHQPGVGVDGDLQVGRIPVVLARRGQPVIPGRHQRAVHDRHRLHPARAHGRQRQQRAEGVDHPVRRGVRDTEQRTDLAHRQIGAPVGGHQQHPIRQLQAPLPTPPAVRDLRPTPSGHDPHQLMKLGRLQPRERSYPLWIRRRDHPPRHPSPSTATTRTDTPTYETALSWLLGDDLGCRDDTVLRLE
jgi:hypothetical protein